MEVVFSDVTFQSQLVLSHTLYFTEEYYVCLKKSENISMSILTISFSLTSESVAYRNMHYLYISL